MTLTTRLLLFAQASLAVVLLGFCAAFYALSHAYVQHQADERLMAAANTLVASIDIEPDSVEWEPSDREVVLGPGPLGGPVCWFITDADGSLVDRSPQAGTEELLSQGGRDWRRPPPSGNNWLIVRRLVHPPGMPETQFTRERTADEVTKGEYPFLAFTVGVPLEPVQRALRALAAGLVGLAAAVWLAGLALGRWVCRRALRPVTEMAAAARAMRADAQDHQLPPPGVGGELDDLYRAITSLLDRLREAYERQRRFTGEASHQLRTPLGILLGQVEVALRRPRLPEEYERVLTLVHHQGSHLARMIEALLFLARADAEAGPLALERMDLRAWLPEFLTSFADHPRNVDLTFELGDEEPAWIAAHRPLLRELVHNLVDNALKYSAAGTPVAIRLGREEQQVTLSVEDQGFGITADDLPHLFEPFFRSADARRSGVAGAGLGLAVSARITAAFGGQLAVANPSSGGSRFILSLPYAASAGTPDKENLIFASRKP